MFQKLLICWDLRTRPSVRFTEEDRKIQRTQDCWVKTACLCQRRMKRVTQIITTKLCRRAGVSAQHAEPSAAEDHTCQARTRNVDQNLWGMFPATCWIWVTKSQFSWSEQSVPNDVAYRCIYLWFLLRAVTFQSVQRSKWMNSSSMWICDAFQLQVRSSCIFRRVSHHLSTSTTFHSFYRNWHVGVARRMGSRVEIYLSV